VRRLAVTTWGTVQGVGFRPFVYAAATSRGLSGWVRNGADAVRIEVQGQHEELQSFLRALGSPPPATRVDRLETMEIPTQVATGFWILDSAHDGVTRPTLAADQAICRDCVAEMDDPRERRYQYPFINCTQCGPRYSIVEALPYDRPSTSMKAFALCDACAREYTDPGDRRFHAQPIACPACGPRVRAVAADGRLLAEGARAVADAAQALLRGDVVALQGLGGFQLLVDATSRDAIRRLRERKRREEKPFAVMVPSLDAARRSCTLSAAEEDALRAAAAPILLVRRRNDGTGPIADGVAPRNPRLGVMLPHTPLHRLLLAAVDRPVVCTSGNLAEEPMCIDETAARDRLGGIADLFLVHDRPIVRPLDDSVARVDDDGLHVVRRARGLAPLPLPLATTGARVILATGAQQKNTIALAKDGEVVVSQHLGDLFSADGVALLERTIQDLTRFFEATPDVIACDLHPDYASTRLAERLASDLGVPLERVQHHHAHVAACMAEHGLSGPVLGLAWDGAGLGADGTIWGGEALVVDGSAFHRVAFLRPFSLPGGEGAMREPSRSALGLLYEILGQGAVEYVPMADGRRRPLLSMLDGRVNCPRTSSMGRLFDAVAALTGVCDRAGYEGQAAMELEFAADGVADRTAYPILLRDGDPGVADWEPLVHALLDDHTRRCPVGVMSARFHNALVDLAEAIAVRAGVPRVVLTGGCFQNLRLTETVRERLRSRGFDVRTPRLYPPNDGGIALGQLQVAACRQGGG
jgi:hydrogenase maturation protein HypF